MKKLISLILLAGCGSYPEIRDKPVDNAHDTETAESINPAAGSESEYKYPQTLYIATVGDLPVCGEGNSRQLIYVAETADFRACLGNDWTVVDLKAKDGADGKNGIDGTPGEKTIEQQEILTETTIVQTQIVEKSVIVEKPVIVEKIVIQETVTVLPGDDIEITPEMPKYRYTHTSTNNSDNKLGTLDYWIYSARIVDIGDGTVFVKFSGYGNGDGLFTHGRLMTVGSNSDFYFPGEPIGPPVLKTTINSLTSITIERTQSDMTGTTTMFTLIAE